MSSIDPSADPAGRAFVAWLKTADLAEYKNLSVRVVSEIWMAGRDAAVRAREESDPGSATMAAEAAPVYHAVCLLPRKSPATGRKARRQEEISLEYQEERMREWCKAGGHTVAAVRLETHHRYMLKSRPALRRVLEECRQGRYDLVLAYDMTRLVSNSNDLGWIEVELRDVGVPLRFVHDEVPEGPFAGAIKSMKAEGSGEEVKLIRRRTGEGKEKRIVTKGRPLARPAPYGMWWNHEAEPRRFKKADDRYHYLLPKRDATADVVRRIFGELAAGTTSLGMLARALNAEGVPAPQGGIWRRSGLGAVVHNPAYCGLEATGARSAAAGPGGGRGVGAGTGGAGRLAVAGRGAAPAPGQPGGVGGRAGHPASHTLRAGAPDGLSARALLRGGRAVCGGCGRAMWVSGRTLVAREGAGTAPAGVTVTYYQCSSSNSNVRVAVEAGLQEACPARACVRADVLDDRVWWAVLKWTPPPPSPERTRGERDARAQQHKGLVAEQRRVLRDLRAGEAQVLHLKGYRRAAQEANNEAWAGRLDEVERELEALAGAERAEQLERTRDTAVLRALTEHATELLACRPWDTDRSRDGAMQGLVAALDVRVVVQRPAGPSKTQRASWGIWIRGQRVVGDVGDGLRLRPVPDLRLDAPVTTTPSVVAALARFAPAP